MTDRRGDTIPVVGTSPFVVETLSWQIAPPQNALVVMVKGVFDIVTDDLAVATQEPVMFTGELRVDDSPEGSARYPSDFAPFKPRADVTLTGHAVAPRQDTTAMWVRFRFGDAIDKKIAVVGDRVWQPGMAGTTLSEPQPFTQQPLVYERSFGGPRHASNPWGRGHGESPLAPNLELPDRAVSSPHDDLPPACFAPIALEHAARWNRMGTYDRDWLATRWPFFPADFDWSFFQAAPADQQLDHLRGDERFEMHGMNGTHPVVRGSLPSMKPRCLLVTRDEARFVPVALRLDSVHFDMDTMSVALVWRGFAEVTALDAPEIGGIFVASVSLDAEPWAEEVCKKQYENAVAAQKAAVAPPSDALPEAQTTPANDNEPDSENDDEAEALASAVRRQLAEAGIDDDELPNAAPPPLDPAAIADALRSSGAAEDDIRTLVEALEEEPPTEDPAPRAPEAPNVRDTVVRALAGGGSLAGADLRGANLSGVDFTRADLTGARLQDAVLTGCCFDDALLLETQLSGADLTDASLCNCNLTLADMTGATLARTKLNDAVVHRATLDRVNAADTSFRGIKGDNTTFVEAALDGCVFDEAQMSKPDMTRATLRAASFRQSALPSIMFYDTVADAAVFDGSELTGARMEGASLTRASFVGVRSDRSVFENATLDLATFAGANLRGVSFLRAVCRKTDFSRADLTESRFDRASLAGAIFRDAKLLMASLAHADLEIADLRGANLHSAGLWGANLLDAKMQGADITKSSLVMRST